VKWPVVLSKIKNKMSFGFLMINKSNQSGMDACQCPTPILSGTGFKVHAVHNHLHRQVVAFVLTGIGVIGQPG